MKKGLRMLMMLCLIASMVGSAGLFACADSGTGTGDQRAVGSGTADNSPTRTSHVIMDTSFSQSGNNSWSNSFATSWEQPHYRVWVENTGNSPISVSVTKDSATGQIQGTMSIPAGEQDYMDMTSYNPGDRYITITPTNGAPYSAYIRAKIASTLGEL